MHIVQTLIAWQILHKVTTLDPLQLNLQIGVETFFDPSGHSPGSMNSSPNSVSNESVKFRTPMPCSISWMSMVAMPEGSLTAYKEQLEARTWRMWHVS